VQVAVHPAGGVGEAVFFFERELRARARAGAVEPPEQRPAALGAEVEREEIPCRHRLPAPFALRGPTSYNERRRCVERA
jgi:hypothetical protein